MRLRYLLILFPVLIAFFVATAPAWLMASLVAYASDGRVQLEQPEGGFWKGHAAYINVAFPDNSRQRLENFSWDVLITHLARGQIASQLLLADKRANAKGVITFGSDGLFANDLDASASADILRAIIPVLDAWKPGGTAAIKTSKLGLQPLHAIEPATVQWNGAHLEMIQIPHLGDYEVRVFPEGEILKFDLKTTSGALRLTGDGQFAPKSGGEFRGEAMAAPAFTEQLAPILRFMGPVNSNGAATLSIRLPPLGEQRH